MHPNPSSLLPGPSLSPSPPGLPRVRDEARASALRRLRSSDRFPASVYRMQFSRDWTFRQAEGVVPFLAALGVEAVFSSPYFQAVPGSAHGYNVTDPNRINPEVGSEAEYESFCRALRERGLKQILDVVPNHMGIAGGHNRYWNDVLRNGPASPYAGFFHIDWEPVKEELKNKVLIPILDDAYGRCLERGDLKLALAGGEFRIEYYDHRLPLSPRSLPLLLEHGADGLQPKLGEGESAEYRAILRLLKSLPEATAQSPQGLRDRLPDQDAAEARLRRLMERSPALGGFVHSRVRLFNGRPGDPASFDLLDELLNRQSYRVAFWKVAGEEVNYRRFFDVNELAALRMEDARVFEHCHGLVFRLLREGKLHGLRIDHPDGLYDPAGYFEDLQRRALDEILGVPEAGADRPRDRDEELLSALPLYLVLEKILDRKEDLPAEWKAHGTVGYDFLNLLNGLFIDPDNEAAMDAIYADFIGHTIDFEELLYDKKKFFVSAQMASEVNMLGLRLNRISEKSRLYRDFTLNTLTRALRETIACFPVYRTYISPRCREASPRDEKYIRIAIEKAKSKARRVNPAVFDFLYDLLLLRLEPSYPEADRPLCRDFVLRFQQLTGPVMAKGLEDTAFYINHRFISLNEVGGDPKHFGTAPAEFHRRNEERGRRWPYGFITTSTHDNKRSEDVRARLNVLSELPDEWKGYVEKWARLNEKHKTLLGGALQPRRNTEYLIYQTLLGVWPDEEPDGRAREDFARRVWDVVLKSVREAKTYTSWNDPDRDYEKAVEKFFFSILAREESGEFLASFLPLQEKVGRWGMRNSLSALVLKCGSPGVMDTYQGDEIWNYRLVDPDNRRPVDYGPRRAILQSFADLGDGPGLEKKVREMAAGPEDGRMKLYTLSRCLNYRKGHRDLFLNGSYVPLAAQGPGANHVIAFLRQTPEDAVLAAATRFPSRLESLAAEAWRGTTLALPKSFPARALRSVLTGETIAPQASEAGASLSAADLFAGINAGLFAPA